MMEWLLLFIVTDGHLNARVETLSVERFPTQQACIDRGDALSKKARYARPIFTCFPVAPLPAK